MMRSMVLLSYPAATLLPNELSERRGKDLVEEGGRIKLARENAGDVDLV